MSSIEGAVIACAGMGTRLGLGLPKCMLEIKGRTILSRLIDDIEMEVERIHVVVGYREELVIEHCRKFHPNVVIVRNPEYRSTSTVDSLVKGSLGFKQKVFFLDGDLFFPQGQMRIFLDLAQSHELLAGVTRAKSSEAVFVDIVKGYNGKNQIEGFSRERRTDLEWANVFVGSPDVLRRNASYVFECLEPQLPIACRSLELYEVDTEKDLEELHEYIEAI